VNQGTVAIGFLNLIAIPRISQLGEFAFMMYFLSRTLRRNESKADMEGAKTVTQKP
jgi:hypothetical protein